MECSTQSLCRINLLTFHTRATSFTWLYWRVFDKYKQDPGVYRIALIWLHDCVNRSEYCLWRNTKVFMTHTIFTAIFGLFIDIKNTTSHQKHIPVFADIISATYVIKHGLLIKLTQTPTMVWIDIFQIRFDIRPQKGTDWYMHIKVISNGLPWW